MKTYVPTIHVNRQSESELRAMFRHAASIAASDQRPATERAAGRRTLKNIQHSLAMKALRP